MKSTYITMTGKLIACSLFAFVALSTGCAGDAPEQPDDPGDSGDPDDPDGDDPSASLDATGVYQIDSRFDLISGMPGTVGEVSNTFIEMTNDPYDPATWLIDTILEEWDGGFVEDIIEEGRPFIDGVVHQAMVDNAPELVEQLVEVGDRFGQVTREFGILSTLEVKADDGDGMSANHTTTGYHFRINSTPYAYTLDELERDPIAVEGVGFQFTDSSIAVSEHSMPLQYGGFLALVLDEIIIPQVNANASDLGDLLNELVDCESVGASLYIELELMSPGFYAGLCEMGLETGAGYVMNKLVSIDEGTPVKLIITGTAKAADESGDRRIDRLSGGKWTGAIDYNGSMGELVQDANTFSGERM